jgi:molybdopterin converting factor small subunit
MQITIRCSGQLRAAIGRGTQTLELRALGSVADALRAFADEIAEDARAMLLDGSGAIQRTLVVAVGSTQVLDLDGHALSDGDTVTILHPISGG